jgi:manganese transport protein
MYNVAEIQDAQVLAPLLGTKWAPILFVALIAAAQFDDTMELLAGQIIMEGYLNLSNSTLT